MDLRLLLSVKVEIIHGKDSPKAQNQACNFKFQHQFAMEFRHEDTDIFETQHMPLVRCSQTLTFKIPSNRATLPSPFHKIVNQFGEEKCYRVD